jgi:branched-chain amino acid transport system ATP-binding protein
VTAAAPLLALSRVEKRFGGLRAIGGVSFEVRERQIFGLIGPNGAGKTTIFNVITGVYAPDAGEVRFGGVRIDGWKPFRIARAGIGRTFQNIRLASEMSVRDNVLVASFHRRRAGLLDAVLRTARYEAEERAMVAKADELLEVFGLLPYAREDAGSLPYGAQRRLEICRALMLEPRLLLLDEPAAGFNSGEADALKEQIRWLRDRFGLTIVLVEHNMHVVMNVCDHVHCVDHGETIADGTPEHVRSHPEVLRAYLGADVSESEMREVVRVVSEHDGAGRGPTVGDASSSSPPSPAPPPAPRGDT